jgi:hypothetical protein
VLAPAHSRIDSTTFYKGQSSGLVVPWRLVTAALLSAAAAVLTYQAVGSAGDVEGVITWGSWGLTAYAGALLCAVDIPWGGTGLGRWKTGPWMLLWYGIAYGLTTLTWRHPPSGGLAGEIAASSIVRALGLMAVAISALTVGYLVGLGRAARRLAVRGVHSLRERYGTDSRSLGAPWILYLLGTVARLASAASTGRFGYVGNASSAVSSAASYAGLLGALSLCAPLAVSAAALQVFREGKRGARSTLACLFVTEVVSGAIAGGKGSFVTAVLAAVIPYGAARRRMPKAALALLVLIFLVIVVPFNQSYRAVARQGPVTLSPSQMIAAAPTILRDGLSTQSLVQAIPESLNLLGQRLSEIGSPAIILQRTPTQVAFAPPLQLIEAPIVGLVPRIFWPAKPIFVVGYQFGQEFFGLPSTLYTSTPDTMAGGLYWHGGWIPLIVGMLLLGAGVRLLDDVLDVRENPQAIFMVMLLFPVLAASEDDWTSILATLPADLFVWILSVALIFGRRTTVSNKGRMSMLFQGAQ